MIKFILNNKTIATDLPPGMALLDFIRYEQQLCGTKIGCREGDCGACTILVGSLSEDVLRYESMTSCLMPLGNANGKHIVTIEGINQPGVLNPAQEAMAVCGATQCGFCTPGFVVSLTGFCLDPGFPSQENAVAAIDGNICRCTGYKSIERAAAMLAGQIASKNSGNARAENPVGFAVEKNFVPGYFSGIKERLQFLGGEIKAAVLKDAASQTERPHFVGGGTDLYVQKHDEMREASIRFLLDHPELSGIRKEGGECIIGPSATVSDMRHSDVFNEAFPGFHRFSKLVSSTPIRNMATVAGNFINASPIGDLTIFFLAMDAQLLLSDGSSRRTLPLRKLYKGYKELDKTAEEHIDRISFGWPGPSHFFNFEKVSKRTHLDIASVNSALSVEMEGAIIRRAGLAAGGVGPVPLFLEKTSAFMEGKEMNEETISGATRILQTEISPISDARGSKEYKTLLLEQLLKAHLHCYRDGENKTVLT